MEMSSPRSSNSYSSEKHNVLWVTHADRQDKGSLGPQSYTTQRLSNSGNAMRAYTAIDDTVQETPVRISLGEILSSTAPRLVNLSQLAPLRYE